MSKRYQKIVKGLILKLLIKISVIGNIEWYNGTEVSYMGKLVCPLCGDATSPKCLAARL